MVGMVGRVGRGRAAERPGAEERRETKAAAGPTRPTETGRVRVSTNAHASATQVDDRCKVLRLALPLREATSFAALRVCRR